jgi:hypothetical protein
LNEHDLRRQALDAIGPSTRASIRAALTASLGSPSGDDVADLFRGARDAARREHVAPALLVDIIASTWSDVADSAGIPAAERGDRLAAILTHAIASVMDRSHPNRTT